jgi:diketogulonate reductase-like aldo/keto reductase
MANRRIMEGGLRETVSDDPTISDDPWYSTTMERCRWGGTATDVAVIGQGTWELDRADRGAAVSALRRGFDLGMTHVDTAEMYGSGVAEELVGEAIVGRRDEVFLVSKVLPSNASRSGTVAACERSLARLRTDRLDGYLLHWPGSHPLEETIAGFEQLARDGKICSYGVSNFDVPLLTEALRIAGAGRIACNQVLYHLQQRAIEHAVLPWCEKHQVSLVGYSPFGSGRFPGPRTTGGRVLEEVAQARGATSRQVALAFLTRRPSLFAIPKAASAAHVAENAGAASLVLNDADIRRIDAAFPRGTRPRSLPTS